jgi:AcrR family transcriptional regulator
MRQHAGMKSRSGVAAHERAAEASRSEARLSFAQRLFEAADAPDLRKSERTRLRLLATIARQLAAGAEQADLRVADVAAAAGLAHGTFYRYFPDLRSALETLMRDFAAFLHDQLAGAREGAAGSRERARSATLVYTRLFRINAGLMRCLVGLGRENMAFRKAFQKLNRDWNRRVASAIARRRTAKADIDRADSAALLPRAYALGGMIDEFLTQLYLRQDPALSHLARDEETVANLLTELWCLGAYGRLPPEDEVRTDSARPARLERRRDGSARESTGRALHHQLRARPARTRTKAR